MKPLFSEPVMREAEPLRFAEGPEDRRQADRRRATQVTLEAAEAFRAAIEGRVDAARVAGSEAVRAELEDRLCAELAVERTAVQVACASFARARARFFMEAEAEVVKLALALAGRVLCRVTVDHDAAVAESVRAALDELRSGEEIKLFVAQEEETAWRRWALSLDRVEVCVEAGLQRGECRLQSPAGVAQLGAQAQFGRLQTGVLELLERRSA